MHIVNDDDPALLLVGFSKSESVAFEKIEKSLNHLQRRADAHEKFLAEAHEKIGRMEILARAWGVRQ
jgi:hypothetical protein